MPTGTHLMTDGSTTKPSAFTATTNRSIGIQQTFNRSVVLKSLTVKFVNAGTFTGYFRVWRTSDQAVIWSSGTSTSYLGIVAGENREFVFDTPPTLLPNVQYIIGYYYSSGTAPSLVTPTGQTFTSTPPGITANYGSNYSNYVASTGYPLNDGSPIYPSAIPLQSFSVDPVNVAPVVSLTAPVNNAAQVPGQPLNISWTYSDADPDPQANVTISVSRLSDNTIVHSVTPAGTATTYAIPGSVFLEDSTYTISLTAYDGFASSVVSTKSVIVDSWTTLPAVPSSAPTGYIDATNFQTGEYEVRVKTSDGSWSEWSDIKLQDLGLPSRTYVRENGVWVLKVGNIRVGGIFKQPGPIKIRVGGTFV